MRFYSHPGIQDPEGILLLVCMPVYHLCFTDLSLVHNKNLHLCETFDGVFKADQLSYFQLKTTVFESVLSFQTSV